MQDEVAEGTSGRTGLVNNDTITTERNASLETDDSIRARAKKLLRWASVRASKTTDMAERYESPKAEAKVETERLMQGRGNHPSPTQEEKIKALEKQVSQLNNKLKNEVSVLVEQKLQNGTLKIGGYDQGATVEWEEIVLPLKTGEEDLEGGAGGNSGYIDAATNKSVAPQSNETEICDGRERDVELGGSAVFLGEEKVEEGEEAEDALNLGVGVDEDESREGVLEREVRELKGKLHARDVLLTSFMNSAAFLIDRIGQAAPADATEGLNGDSTNEEHLALLRNNVDDFSSIVNHQPHKESEHLFAGRFASSGRSSIAGRNEAESSARNTSIQEGEDLPEGEDEEKPQKAPKNQMILVDQDTGSSHSFQDSIYLLLITENVCSPGFICALLITAIAVSTLGLVLVGVYKDKQDGNLLGVPVAVSLEVRIAQFLGAIIGIFTEQETVQGIVLLHFGIKSSLQLNVSKEKVQIKRRKVLFSSFCFILVGYLFLINLLFVIAKADEVLSLFFDIVALEFVLHVDDLFFLISKSGILGEKLQRATDKVYKIEVEESPSPKSLKKCRLWQFFTPKLLYLLNFLIVFVPFVTIMIRQITGWYGCNSITVTFPEDETWVGARVKGENDTRELFYSSFNGVYKRNGTHNKYPRYSEQNKENGEQFISTIGAEIIYCRESKSWVFTHPNIDKPSEDDAEEDGCKWLMRSFQTQSYNLIESAKDDWDVWVGTIQPGSSLSVLCDECETVSDCNYHGSCNQKKCDCDKDSGNLLYFGEQCQLERPCEVLVTESIDLGSRTQLYRVTSNVTKEGFVTSYNRPIYVMNGLSGIPGSLLSVGIRSEGSNAAENGPFKDDESKRNYDPLYDKNFDFGETNISLRNYAVILAFSGSRWYGTIDKPDLNVRKVYNAEYHSFWNKTFSERTFLVSGPTSDGSPIGAEFFSPRRRMSNNKYGPFGDDIDGVGFFQCYAISTSCTFTDISFSTQNKSLPSNMGDYFNEDQKVSWELGKVGLSQFEQESPSVLLGATLKHVYCLPDGAYTFQMVDEVCQSSWWACEYGPGESRYNVSINDVQIREAYGLFQESKFTFSLQHDSTSAQQGNFCHDVANFNVTIHTDGSPYEISWKLTNAEGSLLLAGGPYPFYKTFTAYNHLACLEDGGYNFTIFDSGKDGMKPPGYYNLMVGGRYLVKGRYLFGSSISTSFNLTDGALSSPPTTALPTMPLEDQHSPHNCSVVILGIAKSSVPTVTNTYNGNSTSWSLFDVKKQAYVFRAQPMNIDDRKPPCLYEGPYTYTYGNPDEECINDNLIIFDGSDLSPLYGGDSCYNDTFSFMVKATEIKQVEAEQKEGKTPTTLKNECMDDFHLVVPNDYYTGAADTSWELSGSDGIILRGDQFGGSSTFYSHRACLGLGTYKFTTWKDSTAQYYLSYRQSILSNEDLDLDQPGRFNVDELDVLKISDLSFNSTDVGNVGATGKSTNSGTRNWTVEGSGRGIEGNSDSFHYGQMKAVGDVNFTIFVESFSGEKHSSMGGIMFRDTLDAGSRHFSMFIDGQNQLKKLYRRTCKRCETFSDGDPDMMLSPNSSVWLRVAKMGNEFNSFYREDDSKEWNRFGPTGFVDFSSEYFYVGIAVAADNKTATAKLEATEVELSLRRNVHEHIFTLWEGEKLSPLDGAKGDWFGEAVVLDGDTMAITALSSTGGIGSVYVFVHNGNTWTEQFKIEPDEYLATIGSVVALEGDTMVITVPSASSGAAIVYTRNGDTWDKENFEESTATLYPHDTAAGDNFGHAVALYGDTIIITSRSEGGSAYVFIREGETWQEQDKLLPNDRVGGDVFKDWFGEAVALCNNTMIVTAPSDDHNGQDSSSAYVFIRTGDLWKQQSRLLPQDGTGGDRFGTAVALDGDTIIVTAPRDDENGKDSGSVYVFIRNGESWDEQTKLLPHGGTAGEMFGTAVALDGDIMVVSARGDDENKSHSAYTYVFIRHGDTWNEVDTFSSLGHAIALNGNTVVTTALGASENGVGRGSAYIFSTPLSDLVHLKSPLSSSVPSPISPSPTTYCVGVDVEINVFTDQYPHQTKWTVSKINSIENTTEIFLRGSPKSKNSLHTYGDKMCLEKGEYEFTIHDSGLGDGICCSYGDGYYDISLDDVVIAQGGEFEVADTISFSIPYISSPSASPSTSLAPSPSQFFISPSMSRSPTFCSSVAISLSTDKFPEETMWTLSKVIVIDGISSTELVLEGSPDSDSELRLHKDEACLKKGEYEFIIYDSHGDGISSPGYYNITVDGQCVAQGGNFGSEVFVSFSIPINEDQTSTLCHKQYFGGLFYPFCLDNSAHTFCDGGGDCEDKEFCDCDVGQNFCNTGNNPCPLTLPESPSNNYGFSSNDFGFSSNDYYD